MLEHRADTKKTVNKISWMQKREVQFNFGGVKDEFACLKFKMHNSPSPKIADGRVAYCVFFSSLLTLLSCLTGCSGAAFCFAVFHFVLLFLSLFVLHC